MDMAIHERWKKIGKFLVMRKNDFNFIILFVALSLSFSPPKPVVSIDETETFCFSQCARP